MNNIHCESCGLTIFEGDMVAHDHVNGLVFCAACSPTWAEMIDNPASFSIDIDEHGEPIALTAKTAEAALKTHLNTGGSLTDKFGLGPW